MEYMKTFFFSWLLKNVTQTLLCLPVSFLAWPHCFCMEILHIYPLFFFCIHLNVSSPHYYVSYSTNYIAPMWATMTNRFFNGYLRSTLRNLKAEQVEPNIKSSSATWCLWAFQVFCNLVWFQPVFSISWCPHHLLSHLSWTSETVPSLTPFLLLPQPVSQIIILWILLL